MKNEKNSLKIGVGKAMQKTFENRQKSLPKWMPKPSKNLQKIDAKKELIFRGLAWCTARPSREDPEPNKHNKSQQETYKPSTQTPQ